MFAMQLDPILCHALPVLLLVVWLVVSKLRSEAGATCAVY